MEHWECKGSLHPNKPCQTQSSKCWSMKCFLCNPIDEPDFYWQYSVIPAGEGGVNHGEKWNPSFLGWSSSLHFSFSVHYYCLCGLFASFSLFSITAGPHSDPEFLSPNFMGVGQAATKASAAGTHDPVCSKTRAHFLAASPGVPFDSYGPA